LALATFLPGGAAILTLSNAHIQTGGQDGTVSRLRAHDTSPYRRRHGARAMTMSGIEG
jgi:hypothetical protein